jgi:DNA-binding transcriptional MerR regulator
MSQRGRKAGLTGDEIETRNAMMIRDRIRGQSWATLAEQHGLSESRCRRVFAAWRKENPNTYQGRPPIELVHEMLERLEALAEQLADIAASTEADTTKIAAINSQADKLLRAAELMQATGILPHDLGTLRIQLDAQVLALRLIRVLNEQGASLELKRALLDELESGVDGVQVR